MKPNSLFQFLFSITFLLLSSIIYSQNPVVLYGLTSRAGQNNNSVGVLYSYDVYNNIYTPLVNFDKVLEKGSSPQFSLIQACDGKLYGVTYSGGTGDSWNNPGMDGVIFQYDPTNMTNPYKKIHDIDGSIGGEFPNSSLIQASNGKLYGVTSDSDFPYPENTGPSLVTPTLFEINCDGTDFHTISWFPVDVGDYPVSYVGGIIEVNGKLYILAEDGGKYNHGFIFEYDITNDTYSKIDLDASNGGPSGTLIQASGGLLWGAAGNGLFSFDISTHQIIIYNYNNLYGGIPTGYLYQAKDGLIYGMTTFGGIFSLQYNAGIIFNFDPNTHMYSKIHDFCNATDGANPSGGLMQASNNILYGTTDYTQFNYNGTHYYGNGIFFSYDITNITYPYQKIFDYSGTGGNFPGKNPEMGGLIELAQALSIPQSICKNSPVSPITLQVIGGGDIGKGMTLKWYSGSCGGKYIGSGNNLQIPAPSATTTYYATFIPTAQATCSSVCLSTTLKVIAPPKITTQPKSTTWPYPCPGQPDQIIPFYVNAEGEGPLSYTWQEKKAPGFWLWQYYSSSKFIFVNASQAQNGYQYRCIVSNACGATTSNPATLYVGCENGTITSQPASQSICQNDQTTFSVSTSCPPQFYQWQVSPYGISNWSNISYLSQNPQYSSTTSNSFFTSTLTLANVPSNYDGYYYRCCIGFCQGSKTSSTAILNVSHIIYHLEIGVPSPIKYSWICSNCPNPCNHIPTPTCLYQWQKSTNGLMWLYINSSWAHNYYITSDDIEQGYYYRCLVTNSFCNCTTISGTLQPGIPIGKIYPSKSLKCVNDSLTFRIQTWNDTNLSFQWYKNDSLMLAGETSDSLYISSVSVSNAGTYKCIVTDTSGSRTSESVILKISTAQPSIIEQSTNLTICSGNPLTLNITSNEADSLLYKWFKNNTLISGASQTSYFIPLTSLSDEGRYNCIVSNACGSTISDTIALAVNSSPLITGQPYGASLCAGSSDTLSINATGSGLSYLWLKNDTLLSAATQTSYIISQLSDSTAGNYTCVVNNGICSATSYPALLTVIDSIVIIQQPGYSSNNAQISHNFNIPLPPPQDSIYQCSGTQFILNVIATGAGNFLYEWYENNNLLYISANDSLIIDSITGLNTGYYKCLIINGCYQTMSDSVFLQVATPPLITQQPTNMTLCLSSPLSLTVLADTSNPVTYLWFHNSIFINGATNSAFSIQNSQLSDEGGYYCVLSNPCGHTTSSNAVISIINNSPAIVNQPIGGTICEGDSISFIVTPSGSGPFSYTWVLNDTIQLWGYDSIYTVYYPISSDSGFYKCIVSNACGSATSDEAALTVNTLPIITQQPSNFIACSGDSASFSVIASGTYPLSYQWYYNDSILIPGATDSLLTMYGIDTTYTGSYFCTITNICGHIPSIAVNLAVNTIIPTIIQQPLGSITCEGNDVSFSVTPSGSSPFSYAWFKCDSLGIIRDSISFRMNTFSHHTANYFIYNNPSDSIYTIYNTVSSNSGSYYVIVSNGCGNITSDSATLIVNTPTVLIQQPTGDTLCSGSNKTFTVAATGTRPLTYQWYKNDTILITNAIDSLYTISGVSATDAGSYFCLVSNTCDTIISDYATLIIHSSPSMVTQPQNKNACTGTEISFRVKVSGTSPFSYQWYRNYSLVSGANDSVFTINNVSQYDAYSNYYCNISNSCGSINSNNAYLTVNSPPTITQQPYINTMYPICAGSNQNFYLYTNGTYPISYQWYKNNLAITGATFYNYQLYSITVANSGIFKCIATNMCGTVTSDSVTLNVLAPPSIVKQHMNDTAICAGSEIRFGVYATGTPPLSYHWYKMGGNNYVNDSIITIDNVNMQDGGIYQLYISNTCGSVNSNNENLSVNSLPTINYQIPPGNTICTSSYENLYVYASGSGSLTYQWYKNNNSISNATSYSYQLSSSNEANVGQYKCEVSNLCGTTTNNTLTVLVAPSIITQPQNDTVCYGSNASFSVTVSGSHPLSYHWYINNYYGNVYDSILTINYVQYNNAWNYYQCNISNTCGSTTSNYASLIVKAPINITQQPIGGLKYVGDSITMSVTATGTTLAYVWLKNDTLINGATNSSFKLKNLQKSDSGQYNAIVSNICGPVTSYWTNITVRTHQQRLINNNQTPKKSDQLSTNNELQIYPNPNDGTFTLELNLPSDGNVMLAAYNVLGQTILTEQHSFQKGYNKLNLNLNGAKKGIYFFNIKTDTKTFNRKVIIE